MPDHRFPKTSWSLVARARGPLTSDRRDALERLCRDYWFPVYAFVRERVGSAETALDRTQGFFARLLEKNDLAQVDPSRGSRFRSWLLACVKHYLANAADHERSLAAGGGRTFESLEWGLAEDHYQAAIAHHLTPERLYERHFALRVLGRVIEDLRAFYAARGEARRFEVLKGCVSGDAALRPYEEIAGELDLTVASVKKAAFDLRERYKARIRAEAARLVERPDDRAEVDEELRHLLAALEDRDV